MQNRKKHNCKNCGPLPVSEFYLNLNSNTPMILCKKCHKKRVTEAQRTRRQAYRALGLRLA